MGALNNLEQWVTEQRRALDSLQNLTRNMIICGPNNLPSNVKNDAPQEVLDTYRLAFEDTFQGPTLDYSKWNTRLPWGPNVSINREEQYYTDVANGDTTAANPFSFNAEGNLVITAAPIDDSDKPDTQQGLLGGQNYSSGVITTRDSLCFQYGYMECCVKAPCNAPGSWVAVWLLNCLYHDNASAKAAEEGIDNPNDKFNPELDFEWVHGPDYRPDCIKMASHYFTGDRQSDDNLKLWTLDSANFREFNNRTNQVDSFRNTYIDCSGDSSATNLPDACQPSYCGAFHSVGIWRKKEFIKYYIDGVEVNGICGPENIITDQLMYLIINFAVGGLFPYGTTSDLADPADYPSAFEIEYARIYLP